MRGKRVLNERMYDKARNAPEKLRVLPIQLRVGWRGFHRKLLASPSVAFEEAHVWAKTTFIRAL
jgi:hypothetical protein